MNSIDLFQFCRLCLTNKDTETKQNLINLFTETSGNIPNKLEIILQTQISNNDGKPNKICRPCRDSIMSYFTFREMCLRSNKILDEYLLAGGFFKNPIENSNSTNETVNLKCNIPKIEKENTTASSDNSEDGNVFGSEEYFPKELTETKRLINEESEILEPIDDTVRDIIGSNIYICDICEASFQTFFDYYDHQEIHSGSPVFKCSKCTEVLCSRKDLIEHEGRHKIGCEVCGLEVLPKSMAAHLIIHTDKFKCRQCGSRHTSNALLEKHIKARHIGVKGFVCHICGKQNSCQSSMSRHMASHIEDRPFQCQYCKFSAKSKNILRVHINRKHLAEKCICEICAKSFKSQPSLIQHMKRMHSGIKHECNVCKKTFIEKYNLKRHMKKHVDQRLYDCKICHKEFFTIRILKDHMNSHRQGCLVCGNCGRKFFLRKFFEKHVLNCKKAGTTLIANISLQ